ncbi:MAG: PQQ-dependent sugar dehydrogenase [Pedobacter sp.]|nr:PQQ-dependent sugar dehydrogenase [Pedobacter sp.]
MKIKLICLPSLLLVIAFQQSGYTQNKEVLIKDGALVYQTNCAGCHGKQLEGASAPSLLSKELKHGADRNSIISSIRNGIPGTEMIKWSGVITDKQIDAVANYVLAVRKSPDLAKTKTEKPLQVQTKHYKLKIERLITQGIERPWGIAFVDAKKALITGNKGELRWMVNGKLDTQKVDGIPKSYASDQVGGMLDVIIDPDYTKNGWVYLAYSHNPANNPDKRTPGMTKIVRGKVKDHHWQEEQVLFQVNDSLLVKGGSRWGCRFLFDKAGYLYFTIGDMDRAKDAQILSRPAGKIYRINKDGTIPKDNPFYGQPGVLEAIYSYGNRNVQGIAQHPLTGVIYGTEHGPQGGDELNIIKKGANYGWPVITYGIDYNGSKVSDFTQKEGMEQPITYWTPSIAVSAITFTGGKLFAKWQNNLLVGALKFEELRRLVVEGDQVKEQEILLKGYGRVRDVCMGPDGALYVLTNSPDAVLRIKPE